MLQPDWPCETFDFEATFIQSADQFSDGTRTHASTSVFNYKVPVPDNESGELPSERMIDAIANFYHIRTNAITYDLAVYMLCARAYAKAIVAKLGFETVEKRDIISRAVAGHILNTHHLFMDSLAASKIDYETAPDEYPLCDAQQCEDVRQFIVGVFGSAERSDIRRFWGTITQLQN